MPGAGALLALTLAALAGLPRSGGLVLPFSPGGSCRRVLAHTGPHVRMQEAERLTRLVALSVGFVGAQYHALPPRSCTRLQNHHNVSSTCWLQPVGASDEAGRRLKYLL
jgi:hypothetical protein